MKRTLKKIFESIIIFHIACLHCLIFKFYFSDNLYIGLPELKSAVFFALGMTLISIIPIDKLFNKKNGTLTKLMVVLQTYD
jgi:hypothetical protein